MIKAQRVKYALMAPAFVVATVVAQLGFTSSASAAAVTWDGGGSDSLFSTAENWSNDVVPTNGDNLIFSATGVGNDPVVFQNDLSGLSVSGISLIGTATGYGQVSITGNAVTVAGSIASTATYDGYSKDLTIAAPVQLSGNTTVKGVSFTGAVNTGSYNLALEAINDVCGLQIGILTGTGLVTITGAGYANYSTPYTGTSSFDGQIRVASGTLYVKSGAFTGGVDLGTSGTGVLSLVSGADTTFDVGLTLAGSGKIRADQNGGGCGGSTPQDVYNTTISGPVTLGSDYTFTGDNNLIITGTYTTNGHTFSTATGSAGSITTPSGTIEVPATEVVFNGDQADDYETVGNKVTATLNGTRSSIFVQAGGLLKGTGTAESITNYGTVNPGNSPGTLTVLDFYNQTGTYQVEIQSKDAYDQLRVGEAATMTAVQLDPTAILDVSLFGDWKVNAGDTFTIIDNRSSDAVSGTFAGLDEGAQFTVDGVTFAISYVGGDGNDVVLTAKNTVSAPNTGVLQAVKQNPAIVAVLGVVSAAAVLGLALRRKNER
jgi:hypothetical protein